MKGYIKIEAGTHEGKEGLFVEGHIEGAAPMDRGILMHALRNALQMGDIEWKLYMLGEHAGLFEEMSEVEDLTNEG